MRAVCPHTPEELIWSERDEGQEPEPEVLSSAEKRPCPRGDRCYFLSVFSGITLPLIIN